MADLKLVGAVAIKVRPDASGFRRETQRQVKKELAGVKAEVEVTAKLNSTKARADAKKLQNDLDGKTITWNVKLDEDSIRAARKQLDTLLPNKEISFNLNDEESIKRAADSKSRIEGLLRIDKLNVDVKLNEDSLVAAMAKVRTAVKATEKEDVDVDVKFKPHISMNDYLQTLAAIKILAKDQTVGFVVKLNNASVLLAAAKLTGLRAAGRWSEELARSLGRLDRNLPIVATVVLTLSTLSSGLLSLTASAFSLGNGLGEVVRMAGLLAPAMLLGLGAVMTVATGVFKDFGAAVNGDTKAIEKLTESGKKAAAGIRVHFQDIRETVSKNFWQAAGDSMLRFVNTALPAVGDGLKRLSVSLGGVFSGLLDSFSLLADQGGVKVFFDNLTRGFDVAQTGMGSFMSGFNTLAVVGSTVFPRIGRAFEQWATRFDAWVQQLAADGTLNRWIDKGIQGLKDLVNAGGSLTRAWANIGQAAQAAGALTLHSFARLSAQLDEATAGERFQRNMRNIFRGARLATESFHKALGDLGPAMDTFSLTIKSTLSGAGEALGAFITTIGDVMSSPRLNTGITAFMSGLRDMFIGLRPAAAPVAEILQTFGEVLGTVARDSGPLFRNLFAQLATILTTAWHALEPFLPALIQIGTTIVNILGPALTSIAGAVIPAFAAGLQDIGDGLIPVIQFLADFAAGAVTFLSSLPLPVVVGLAGGILSLGASFKFVAATAPIAAAALQLLGIEAGIAAARAQLMIPVVGLVLAALTGLAIGGVAALATSQQSAIPHANAYADALREDAKAAAELGKATDEAVKKTAIENLQDAGAFRMARELGISIGTVTKAALGNARAQEEVQRAVDKVNKTYDDNFEASARANKAASSWGGTVRSSVTPAMGEAVKAGKDLLGILKQEKDSFAAGKQEALDNAEANKAMGISTLGAAKAHEELSDKAATSGKNLGAAAAASRTLTDVFSSGPAKIDAMRKSLEILVGTNAKQKAAETLGAYVKGFNDLKESVTPLAQDMRNLGDAVYGETGFLNVGGGNKAVLQVNQALVDQVDAIWLGAKTAYEAAIQQGETAVSAFAKAKEFVDKHRGDYDALAEASGVAKDKVQGNMDAVFGKEWVLKVSFSGLTETAAIAQNMIAAVKGQWDGEEFTGFFDLNPDKALLAMENPIQAAKDFVKSPFVATFDALPKPAQDKIKALVGLTNEQWTDASFQTLLAVTKDEPALQQTLIDLRNGVEGVDLEALVKAVADNTSIQEARNALDELEAQRKAKVSVDADTGEADKKINATMDNVDRLSGPHPVPLIDFETKGADDKLTATKDNVDRLTGPHPVPLIDADTSEADKKFAATQKAADELGDTRPKPVVEPQTAAGDQQLGTTQGLLDGIDQSRPNPFVSVQTAEASQLLRNLQAQIDGLRGKSVTMTITTQYLTSGNPVHGAGQVAVDPMNSANGNILKFRNNVAVKAFANGGIEKHVAQITKAGGPVRVWAEAETQGEAYVPYAMSKRPRSVAILSQVAKDFGYQLTKATNNYANGGTSGVAAPSRHNTASVHIGQLITTDPTEAVRKIRISQQDALAVAGISLNGA